MSYQKQKSVEISIYNHVELGVNIHNFPCNKTRRILVSKTDNSVLLNKTTKQILPESSTTGRAETRLSTKMLSALMMGVSGWMKAMSW